MSLTEPNEQNSLPLPNLEDFYMPCRDESEQRLFVRFLHARMKNLGVSRIKSIHFYESITNPLFEYEVTRLIPSVYIT